MGPMSRRMSHTRLVAGAPCLVLLENLCAGALTLRLALARFGETFVQLANVTKTSFPCPRKLELAQDVARKLVRRPIVGQFLSTGWLALTRSCLFVARRTAPLGMYIC